MIISNTYVLGSPAADCGRGGIQLYSASSKNDSSFEPITLSIRASAALRAWLNDWTEVNLTGPPRCDALIVSYIPTVADSYLPQMHQDTLELLAGGAEVFEIDNNLGDLRKIAHALKLFRNLLAHVV